MAAIPQTDVLRCGLSWAAKVACSGKYLTGRDPVTVLKESAAWMFSDGAELERLRGGQSTDVLLEGVTVEVDGSCGRVTVSKQGVHGVAQLQQADAAYGAWVIDPDEPPAALMRPADRPTSTSLQRFEPGSATAIDLAAVESAVELVFRDPRQMTNAFLVAHRGVIVVERYRSPFGPDTRFESWSMGKSLASTLIGRLHAKGKLGLDEAELFDEWRGDERSKLRLRHLLNMSSGLQFSGSMGRGEDTNVKARDGRFLDHIYVYASGCDSYSFCLEKPQELPAGSAVRYRNCDPLLAMRLLKERGSSSLAEHLTAPKRLLFDPLGAEHFVLETDPYGGFLISGHDYGTARDWARVGQLWLQRGAWGAEQLLEESYVNFALTPAPGSEEPYYGGFVLLNEAGIAKGLPRDAFWFSGGGLQRTIVVPSKELVIVRLGHIFGARFRQDQTMQEANAMLCAAVQ